MKKVIKNPIFTFILGALIFGSGVLAANTLMARDIKYTPADTNWAVDNVEAAINSLQLSKTSDNYSTEERVVGTWIDGKTLYQRTIKFISNGASWTNIASDIDHSTWETSFVETIFINTTSDASFYGGNQTYGILVHVPNKSKDEFSVHCPSWTNGNIGFVTVRYTKTTDTAPN